MYVLIETAGIELVGVWVESVRSQANKMFDRIVEENHDMEVAPTGEIAGTVRIAGDDTHCIQMVQLENLLVRK